MSVDFSKHTVGDVVRVHCCNDCAYKAGVIPKYPADSGNKSWMCDVCGHFGIGSATDCTIGDWLILKPNASSTAAAGDINPVKEMLDGFLGSRADTME